MGRPEDACPLDCPDVCTLDVTVGDDGPLERVEGAGRWAIPWPCVHVGRVRPT